MKCRELAEFLMDYATGELPPEVRADFEQHLTRCHNCHEYLVEYENTIKAGKLACTGADADVPDDVPEDLVKAILAALKR
jgi:anti-sigma factor RsiW